MPPRVVGLNRDAALPYFVLGGGCVVAGGLLSAVSALAPSELTAWAAAYLVLVAGVAQVGLGVAQGLLTPAAPSRRVIFAGLLGWNAGNALVLAGTALEVAAAVDAGGVLLVLVLVQLLRAARGGPAAPRWLLPAFRALVLLLVVSVPVGLVLARLRSG